MQSWLRLPAGSTLRAKAGPEGCKVWVKTGHLLHIQGVNRLWRATAAHPDPGRCGSGRSDIGEVSLMQKQRASPNSTNAENIVLAGTPAVTIAALVAAALIVPRREAVAWSVYSRQTGLRCEQCHTPSGKLTTFGAKFKANGNKVPEPKPD